MIEIENKEISGGVNMFIVIGVIGLFLLATTSSCEKENIQPTPKQECIENVIIITDTITGVKDTFVVNNNVVYPLY